MSINIKNLNTAIDNFASDLNGGLAISSLWVRGQMPLVSYGGGNDKAAALFDQISDNIEKAIKIAGFPKIDPYYLWKVEGNMIIGAVLVENVQTGMVIDLSKTTIGVVLNIAIPNLVVALKEEFIK